MHRARKSFVSSSPLAFDPSGALSSQLRVVAGLLGPISSPTTLPSSTATAPGHALTACPPLLLHRAFSADSGRADSGASASTGPRLSYPSHVPLSPLENAAVALYASIGALTNPRRADLVAAVGETTGARALERMRAAMIGSEEGKAILAERPRIDNRVMEGCKDLPDNTFGAAYYRFMSSREFEADERPLVRFINDEELAYVAQRSREVHDLWHVLFACKTTVLGELALKAVEFLQTGLPMAGLSVAGAQFRLKPEERQLLWSTYMPWASRAGSRCAPLMSIYYERHFGEDLEDLRRRWRIEPAPAFPNKNKGLLT